MSFQKNRTLQIKLKGRHLFESLLFNPRQRYSMLMSFFHSYILYSLKIFQKYLKRQSHYSQTTLYFLQKIKTRTELTSNFKKNLIWQSMVRKIGLTVFQIYKSAFDIYFIIGIFRYTNPFDISGNNWMFGNHQIFGNYCVSVFIKISDKLNQHLLIEKQFQTIKNLNKNIHCFSFSYNINFF